VAGASWTPRRTNARCSRRTDLRAGRCSDDDVPQRPECEFLLCGSGDYAERCRAEWRARRAARAPPGASGATRGARRGIGAQRAHVPYGSADGLERRLRAKLADWRGGC
jgi:hypothetical protein